MKDQIGYTLNYQFGKGVFEGLYTSVVIEESTDVAKIAHQNVERLATAQKGNKLTVHFVSNNETWITTQDNKKAVYRFDSQGQGYVSYIQDLEQLQHGYQLENIKFTQSKQDKSGNNLMFAFSSNTGAENLLSNFSFDKVENYTGSGESESAISNWNFSDPMRVYTKTTSHIDGEKYLVMEGDRREIYAEQDVYLNSKLSQEATSFVLSGFAKLEISYCTYPASESFFCNSRYCFSHSSSERGL